MAIHRPRNFTSGAVTHKGSAALPFDFRFAMARESALQENFAKAPTSLDDTVRRCAKDSRSML
jgi:hypothetical protein